MDKTKTLFAANIVIALFFLTYSLIKKSVYIFDSFLYLFMIWFFWRYGKKLNQNNTSMALVFVANILHNFGVFGFFSNPPFGLPYDKILHSFSGVYLTYALFLIASSRMRSLRLALFFAVMCALGFSALGELSEFSGWMIFPPRTSFEGGLLDPGVGKFLQQRDYLSYVYMDTITDMAWNLGFSLLTAAFLAAKFLKSKPKK